MKPVEAQDGLQRWASCVRGACTYVWASCVRIFKASWFGCPVSSVPHSRQRLSVSRLSLRLAGGSESSCLGARVRVGVGLTSHLRGRRARRVGLGRRRAGCFPGNDSSKSCYPGFAVASSRFGVSKLNS